MKINKNGFTFIELLFAITLLGFMITMVMTTFIGIFRIYAWSNITTNNQFLARQTMDNLNREIASSTSIVTTGPNTALCYKDYNSNTYKIYVNNRVLKKDSYNPTTPNCTGTPTLSANFSSPDMPVKSITFTNLTTQINSSYTGNFQQAVVVKIEVINYLGTVPAVFSGCGTSIYCSVVQYDSASSRRKIN